MEQQTYSSHTRYTQHDKAGIQEYYLAAMVTLTFTLPALTHSNQTVRNGAGAIKHSSQGTATHWYTPQSVTVPVSEEQDIIDERNAKGMK